MLGYQGLIKDITRRVEVERKLAETHTRLQLLVSSLKALFIGVDEHGRVIQWNKTAENLLGVKDSMALGHPLQELPLPWDREQVKALLAELQEKKQPLNSEIKYTTRDGENHLLGATFSPVLLEESEFLGFVILGIDVTEIRKKQSQEALAQKMQAIGRLAAGIAHEINTPLQYIGDNTQFLGEAFNKIDACIGRCEQILSTGQSLDGQTLQAIHGNLEATEIEYFRREIPRAIEQTMDGISRVSRLVRALKEFSHPGSREKTYADINKALENVVIISKNEWKYVADVQLDLDPQLPLVYCLLDELNQVFLNMVVNAAQAIKERASREAGWHGRIVISTALQGDQVYIAISDNGTGIEPENIPKIFEPFYTTKDVGQGSGQGLAIAHDIIVNKHGGYISVESEPGQGATFTIVLPVE